MNPKKELLYGAYGYTDFTTDSASSAEAAGTRLLRDGDLSRMNTVCP